RFGYEGVTPDASGETHGDPDSLFDVWLVRQFKSPPSNRFESASHGHEMLSRPATVRPGEAPSPVGTDLDLRRTYILNVNVGVPSEGSNCLGERPAASIGIDEDS